MNLPLLKKLVNLRPRDRGLVGRFMEDRRLRLKVVEAMQARGIGVGIDPDNIAKWLELIIKYMPIFLEIILKLI